MSNSKHLLFSTFKSSISFAYSSFFRLEGHHTYDYWLAVKGGVQLFLCSYKENKFINSQMYQSSDDLWIIGIKYFARVPCLVMHYFWVRNGKYCKFILRNL